MITKSWEEFELIGVDKEVELKMNPTSEKKPLLSRLLPLSSPKLKIAFIYEKTPSSSAWTYAHELGRLHLEEAFSSEVETLYYDNVTARQRMITDAIFLTESSISTYVTTATTRKHPKSISLYM